MQIAALYYGRVFMLVTGILVLAALCGRSLGPSATVGMLVAGVAVLGLPHGALDPMVARKVFAGRRSYSTGAFYGIYLGMVLGFGLLWWRLPTLGLSIFLVMASFHFGSDWHPRGTAATRLAYGLAVVTLPALLHPIEVARIYTVLGTAHAQTLVDISRAMAVLAAIAAAIASIARRKQCRSDAWEFMGIVVGSILLQPLVFFACYFSLLHSPRHLLEAAERLRMTSLQSIYSRTLPIVMATVALCAGLYFVIPDIPVSDRLLVIVFVGLASLTVPHMLLDAVAAQANGRRATRFAG